MSELRQNAVTGRWVVVAPARGERPNDAGAPDAPSARRRRDPDCPFCPGNEAALPSVLWELSAAGDPGWRCRAVPNRYAAFSGSAGEVHPDRGREPGMELLVDDPETPEPGRIRGATGTQEVLVESPRHDRPPETMTGPELDALTELYRSRLGRLVREEPHLSPCLFRNEGAGAGASLRHPHAQIIATRDVPTATAVREARQVRYRERTGRCLLCDLPDAEPDGRDRTVIDDPHFRVEVPWAPERPLEAWIVPRAHGASFSGIGPDEASAFGRVLNRLLGAVRTLAGDVDYNYILHSAAGARASDPALHWFLQLRPVTARMAGFELGAGVVVNSADPLDDAESLRHALQTIETDEKKGDTP